MEKKHNTPHEGGPGPGPNMAAANAKDFSGTWKKLLQYCKKYWPVMIAAIIAAAAGTVLTLLGPDKISELTGVIMEGVMTGIDMDAVAKIGMTLVAFYGCSWLLSLVQQLMMSETTQRVSRSLRNDISHKINRLPMWYYNRTTTGDILSRVTNDVDTVAQSLQQSVGTLISSLTLFVGALIMMLKTNVTLAITAVVATIIGFALMGIIMGRSQKYFAAQQKALGAVNGHIEEMYSGHTVVKAYNAEEKSQKTFHELNENLRGNGFKAMCLAGMMQPLMGFVGNFGYVAVCVVGAMLTMDGKIGFEVIVAFMLYVRYFTQPLSQLGQATQSLQQAAAAGERVFEFLEAEEMADESDKKKRYKQTKGQVVFDHVLWIALGACIGLLYFTDLLSRKDLFMITVAFYVCDLICVLIWCPFRLMMKNKCCTTCRIFNWDHLMMFTPMLFVPSFYSWSLLLMSLVVWVVWELCVLLYPERFWEMTNEALRCSNCTDKLCTQYCQKLRH